MSRTVPRPVLAGIVIAGSAVALRVWRLSWGLVDGAIYPDEMEWVPRAMPFLPVSWGSFLAGDLLFPYPTLYGYLVGLGTALADALGLLAPPPALQLDIMLVARSISAAVGVVSVGLVGILARRMDSPHVGLTAAALMAVVPIEVLQVRLASVDVLLVACTTLTLLASHALATRGTTTLAALAGMSAGLAFATKYTALAVLATVGLVVLGRAWVERSPRRAIVLGAAALAGFAIAVLIACPPCLLHPGGTLAAMEVHRTLVARAIWPNERLSPSLGWYGRPYLYQLVASLPFSLGWPLYLLALAGIGVALRRRDRADGVLVAALLPYFALVGSAPATGTRHLLPLVPALVVLAARAAALLRPRTRLAVLGGVWLYSLAFTASQLATVSYDQQKELARWIASAFPPSTTRGRDVAVPNLEVNYMGLDPFLERAGLRVRPVAARHWFDADLEVFVLAEWQEIAIRRDMPTTPMARSLEQLVSGAAGFQERARWSPWYLQRGFYAWLDPGLGPWLGQFGFRVFSREPPDRGRRAP